jgi:crotonobetainyl-CoA:carnitine CoA-transferase CaiB-like acyl-CoA transferase
MSGEVPGRLGRSGVGPFWHTYQGSDGKYFCIGMLLDRGWRETCEVIGRTDLLEDERFRDFRSRVGQAGQPLVPILQEAFAAKPAAEWVRLLNEAGVFATYVQNYEDLANDPQVIANDYIAEVPRDGAAPLRMLATPITFARTPVELRSIAPELGQHTEEVLLEFGYSWDEIDALRQEGAIGPKQA